MIERLNQNNFKSVSVVKNESFEDFKNYITDKGLHINCFYINPEECYKDRTWYIEDYLTYHGASPVGSRLRLCVHDFKNHFGMTQ